MATHFVLGSITDIVNSTGEKSKHKKHKHLKSTKKEKEEEEPVMKLEEDEQLPQSENDVVDDENDDQKNEEKITKSVKDKINKKEKKRKSIELDQEETVDEGTISSEVKKSKKKRKTQLVNEEDVEQPISEQQEVKLVKKVKDKSKVDSNEARKEKLSRTVFVGNLPANFSLKNLKKMFAQHGSVASIRVRSVAPAKENLSKKAAFLSKQINQNKATVNAYIVFHSADSVEKALSLNGTQYENGNHLRVDKVLDNPVYENTLSVFLGNLPFKTTDNQLRDFFNDCGELNNVRVIRDSQTGIGKGFGYVTFTSKDAVVLALEKNGESFNGREIRIQPYNYTKLSKNPKGKKDFKSKSFKANARIAGKEGGGKSELNLASKSSPNKFAKKTASKDGQTNFKGELASKKKMNKKTLKNRIKSGKANKQKKKIAEILSK